MRFARVFSLGAVVARLRDHAGSDGRLARGEDSRFFTRRSRSLAGFVRVGRFATRSLDALGILRTKTVSGSNVPVHPGNATFSLF